MLIAARSSKDFACCWRATESARSKYDSAFLALHAVHHKAADAINMITSGITELRSTGATGFGPFYLGYLAEAYRVLHQLDEAWRVIDEAISAIHEPTLHEQSRTQTPFSPLKGQALRVARALPRSLY
jgi:hypothetical protein